MVLAALMKPLSGSNKYICWERAVRFSEINISDFNHENISNESLWFLILTLTKILKSVLNGSGQKPHKYVVALNAALVLWTAGIEEDLHECFKKALFSINQGEPWKKLLLLKEYLSSDKLIWN